MGILIFDSKSLASGGGSKFAVFQTKSGITTYEVTVTGATQLNQLFYDGALLPSSSYTATVTSTNIEIVFSITVDNDVICQIVYQ